MPRHPPCALKNLSHKDARVHCVVLNIRNETPQHRPHQPTTTNHSCRLAYVGGMGTTRAPSQPRHPTTNPHPKSRGRWPDLSGPNNVSHPHPENPNHPFHTTTSKVMVVLGMSRTRDCRPITDVPPRASPHGTLVRARTATNPPSNTGQVVLLRKEVIQPHLPVRLPCYDLVPITSPTFDGSLPRVGPPASGVTDFRDLTGGVYKARERIHRSVADLRLLATPTSWGRVADPNPN